MTVRYLGELTLGGVVPGAAMLSAAGTAGINAALPDLQSRLAGLLAFKPTPVSFTAQIATLKDMIAGIEATIAVGLPAPGVSTQLAAIAELVAALQSQVGALNAQLSVIANLQAALGAAGIHAYAYEGAAGSLAAELGGAVGSSPGISPADVAHALALVTTVPATWAAMSSLLRVA